MFEGEPMSEKLSLKKLIQRVHNDEKGGVSLETILIIAAIALPILIFLITVAWPRIQEFFSNGMEELESGAENAQNY